MYIKGPGNSVSTVLVTGRPNNRGSIPSGDRSSSFRNQISTEAHPKSYPLNTRCFSLDGKTAAKWRSPLISIWCRSVGNNEVTRPKEGSGAQWAAVLFSRTRHAMAMSGFTNRANKFPAFATSCTRLLNGICYFLYQAFDRHLPLLVPGNWKAFATSCTRHLNGICYFLYQALDRHLPLLVPGTWPVFATSCTMHLTGICHFLYQALDGHLLLLVPGAWPAIARSCTRQLPTLESKRQHRAVHV
jgi:hypothetical protein